MDAIAPHTIPTDLPSPKVQKAAQELRKLHSEWATASARVSELEAKRAEAVAEDEQAYAEALRAGKPDPGRKAEEAVVAELEAERRRAGALAVAGKDAQRDLLALVHAEAAGLRARFDQDAASAHEDYRRAVEAVVAARARIDSVQSVARWLTTLLDTGRSVTKVSPGFMQLDGREVGRTDVLAALRADANPKVRTPA